MAESPTDFPNFEEYSTRNQIDMICDVFERAHRDNSQPSIERFLQDYDVDQAALLAELLALELELSPGRSGVDRLPEYIARFPEHADLVRQVFERNQDASRGRAETTVAWGVSNPRASFLERCPLFASVPIALLEPAFVEQEFAAGEYLMRQGELGKSLLVVCEGSVEISTEDPGGVCHVIDYANTGQVLGEMALLTSEPRSASARALSRVRARVLPSDAFHRLAHKYPELSVALTHLVADRLGRPSRDALTDKVLDDFRIQRQLGRGGMGVVYEANTVSNGERVALKMMSHRLVHDAEALRSFHQEADIIQSFEHPNIVKMYGRFVAFKTFFIVLEYCPGRSLADVLVSEGPMAEERFRLIAGQIASALDYAHRANVVHRDIKPSNVMLGDADAVKLMDFGLAEAEYTPNALAGRVVGTPRYMAPEQRAGEAASREADYFSFACLAYEILTAKPVCTDDAAAELSRSFVDWTPPAIKTIRPDLDPMIDTILRNAFHVDPVRRYLDLAALAEWAQ